MEEFLHQECKEVHIYGLDSRCWANKKKSRFKRFAWEEGATYPDGGCNFETFSNEEFLEIESLGAMVSLEPDVSVTHEEEWSLFRGVAPCATEDDVDAHILPLIR